VREISEKRPVFLKRIVVILVVLIVGIIFIFGGRHMYNSGYWGGEGLAFATYGIYLEWIGWGFTVAAILGGVYLTVKSRRKE
jgi:hypothetical protein